MSLTPAQCARFGQLKSSGQLPSPKGPALAVVKLTRQDTVSFAQLAQAVKADPALAADTDFFMRTADSTGKLSFSFQGRMAPSDPALS